MKLAIYTDGGCMGYYDDNATGAFGFVIFKGFDISKRFTIFDGIVNAKGIEIGRKFGAFEVGDGTIWHKGDVIFDAEPEINTTNNRMELKAVINALKQAKRHYGSDIDVRVYSDSGYVVNGINNPSYSKKWMHNGWINSKKKPVENKDLWVQLIAEIQSTKKVELINIKGHGKNSNDDHNYYNNICDSLCTHIINSQLDR